MLLISFQFCICHMQTASWLLMGFPCMRALKATRPLLHMGASLNFLRAAFVVWTQCRAQLFHAEGQGQQANQQPANPTLNVLHSGRPYLKSKSLFAHLQGSPPCAASQPAGSTSQHYGGELLGRLLRGCRSVEDLRKQVHKNLCQALQHRRRQLRLFRRPRSLHSLQLLRPPKGVRCLRVQSGALRKASNHSHGHAHLLVARLQIGRAALQP